MSLYFTNFYPAQVSVAIMWYDPLCGETFPGNCWTRQGWFNLSPFNTKKVLPNKEFPNTGNDLSDINRFYCFFAKAQDGAVWAGPFKRGVNNSRFHFCDCIGVSHFDFTAGFRLFDVNGHDDYTVILVP